MRKRRPTSLNEYLTQIADRAGQTSGLSLVVVRGQRRARAAGERGVPDRRRSLRQLRIPARRCLDPPVLCAHPRANRPVCLCARAAQHGLDLAAVDALARPGLPAAPAAGALELWPGRARLALDGLDRAAPGSPAFPRQRSRCPGWRWPACWNGTWPGPPCPGWRVTLFCFLSLLLLERYAARARPLGLGVHRRAVGLDTPRRADLGRGSCLSGLSSSRKTKTRSTRAAQNGPHARVSRLLLPPRSGWRLIARPLPGPKPLDLGTALPQHALCQASRVPRPARPTDLAAAVGRCAPSAGRRTGAAAPRLCLAGIRRAARRCRSIRPAKPQTRTRKPARQRKAVAPAGNAAPARLVGRYHGSMRCAFRSTISTAAT